MGFSVKAQLCIQGSVNLRPTHYTAGEISMFKMPSCPDCSHVAPFGWKSLRFDFFKLLAHGPPHAFKSKTRRTHNRPGGPVVCVIIFPGKSLHLKWVSRDNVPYRQVLINFAHMLALAKYSSAEIPSEEKKKAAVICFVKQIILRNSYLNLYLIVS